MRKRLLIVGGGIAGLATAWHAREEIRRAGRDVEITLLESAERLGGKIVTRHHEGFVMEGGPDSFLTEKPWGLDLCRKLGLADELVPSQDANRAFHIRRGRRFHPFPAGMRLFVPQEIPPLLASGLLSWTAKLRLMLEPFQRARPESAGDESLSDFVTRRCGREALEYLAGPILAGIYAADPDRLSMECAFPQLVALERKYGSLTRGFRELARQRKPGPPAPIFTSLRGGMGRVVERLAEELADLVRTRSPAQGLAVRNGRYDVSTPGGVVSADAVVLAQPAHAASRLVQPFHAGLADRLGQLRFNTSLTLSLGFRQADLPHGALPTGFGFMIPRCEQEKLLGCTWATNKFPDRSAAGTFLCRLFVAGPVADEWARLPDAEIVAAARTEAERLTGIRAEPVTSWVVRWEQGNPQYETGHAGWLRELDRETSRMPGLFLTGSSYRGVSMSDCVRDAATTAANALRFLGET